MLRIVLVGLICVGAFLFVTRWRSAMPMAVGTGDCAGLATRDNRSATGKAKSQLAVITDNATRYENQRVSRRSKNDGRAPSTASGK